MTKPPTSLVASAVLIVSLLSDVLAAQKPEVAPVVTKTGSPAVTLAVTQAASPTVTPAVTPTVTPVAPKQERVIDEDLVPWRTVRSGEGFRAQVFGQDVNAPARDRRYSNSVDAGIGRAFGADDAELQANAYVYFWRQPEDGHLLRGVLGGIYDELLWAAPIHDSGLERVLTFTNDTAPWSDSELIDGVAQDSEELAWGYVRLGVGIGFRRRVGEQQDNLFATDLIIEPGLLWFADGDRTDPTYETPETTFELRTHLQMRLDMLARNLLELPHEGFAFGADLVHGFRADWHDWGMPGDDLNQGADGDTYLSVTGYAFGITELPLIGTERQRIFASVHAGDGDNLDRFSAQRVGGGPDRRGIEFDTTVVPLLPGAARNEFFPDHYLILSAGFRQEVTFFAFIDAGAAVAWLDRDRAAATGSVRQNDQLSSVFTHLNSGFFGATRFQLGYAYGFDLIRDGDTGGNEILLQVTGRF
ncbi:MAG: hypothetical protein EXS02_05200 [Planctomycetes bacterium]|nr:hypothetical protein [Planctomycetota bacterium]